MEKDISVLTGFLQSLDSYKNLHKIELLQSESNGVYKAYKIIYLNNTNEKVKLRIELDYTHKKLSSGQWKDTSLSTKKFKHYL